MITAQNPFSILLTTMSSVCLMCGCGTPTQSNTSDAGDTSDTSDTSDAQSHLDAHTEDTSPDSSRDTSSACSPFEGSAPRPPLGECARTLPTEKLEATTRTMNDVEVIENQWFASRGDHELHADLYLPQRVGVTGALVVVHGGGWLDCDNRRDSMSTYALLVASILGIPTITVDYRLGQEGGGYPENVMDVKCAVQWVRQNASAHGIDPDRVGIMGSSAGAHLALMTALTEDRDDLDPGCADIAPEVSLTLAYSGPSDLPRFVGSDSEAAIAPTYYTGESCDTPVDGCVDARACSRCVDASPLSHACHADEDPIVLFQAPDPLDPLVAQIQNELLHQALQDQGANVQLALPSLEQMEAAGCGPGSVSHGSDMCLLLATQPILDPAIEQALGPR